ncbi:MAG TPA: response regulator [Gammaproteobacteria bacterium]|nr:response regulator [Gammaproteobacteria bacterium]
MNSNDLQRILFVEDEADIQAVAQVALEAVGGFTVRICSSGEEALRVAEAFAPQLILSDVMMPDMDGPATLIALRRLPALADTPAIFMTARVLPQEVEQLRASGAMAVIAKPFDPMTLAQQIKDIWGQSHA